MHVRRLLILSLLAFALVQPVLASSPGIILTLTEADLGQWIFEWFGSELVTVGPGQPLNFNWTADAQTHDGTITEYRFGWDIVDAADPNDPGWAMAWQEAVLNAQAQSFQQGTHNFVVLARDDLGRETRAVIVITVDSSTPTAPISWGRVKSRS
jgi:hypothetical protein